MKELAALELLLGAYLHEDWADDYPDLWHAIDDFTEGEPQLAPRIPGDVKTVLTQYQGEQEIQQALYKLGMKYYPPGGGWESYRAFVLAVAARVEQNLHKSPAA
jgi:contact-dependent growth inhibition (CDI) system CdiI-like immunity protein